MKEIFTVDNLLHSLVAVAFTCLSLIALKFGAVPAFLPWTLAALAGIGLYLREVSQDDWHFLLPDRKTGTPSFHKWMEAVVGTVAAFIAAAIIVVVT